MKNKYSSLALLTLFSLSLSSPSVLAATAPDTLTLDVLQQINQKRDVQLKNSTLSLQPVPEMNTEFVRLMDNLHTLQVAGNIHNYKHSINVFNAYIDIIDPDRLYLTKSDINLLKEIYTSKNPKTNLLVSKKVDSGFDIYKYFLLRKAEVYKGIIKYLESLKAEPNLNLQRKLYKGKGNSPESVNFNALMERNKDNFLYLLINQKFNDKEDYNFEKSRKKFIEIYKSKLEEVQNFNTITVIQDIFLQAVAYASDSYSDVFGFNSSGLSYKDPKTGKTVVIGFSYEVTPFGEFKILRLTKDGPLEKTGKVNVGDIILAISNENNKNYVSFADKTISQSSGLFKGRKGSVVYLKLRDAKTNKEKEVKVIRDTIGGNSTSFQTTVEYFDDGRGGDIAKIEFGGFDSGVAEQINKVITSNSKTSSIILDLRDNGGGSVYEAHQIVSQLNPKRVVSHIVYKPGKALYSDYTDPKDPDFINFAGPLFILVNRHSASASEMISASFQDSKRAYIFGGLTYGKGIAQTTDFMVNKEIVPTYHAKFKRTIYYALRANGVSVQNVGITPDFKLPDTSNLDFVGMVHNFNPPPNVKSKRGGVVIYKDYVTPKITADLTDALAQYIAENKEVYSLWEEYAKAESDNKVEDKIITLNYDKKVKRQEYMDDLYLRRVNAQQRKNGEKEYKTFKDIPKDYELDDINLNATVAVMKRYIPHLAASKE